MSLSVSEIFAILQERCKVITTKPKTQGLSPLHMQQLVAWKDGLEFTPVDLASAQRLFDLGITAIRARFEFARENYRVMRGDSEVFAEEFAVRPQVDQERNEFTGAIELHAQMVLKPLTPAPEKPDSTHGQG